MPIPIIFEVVLVHNGKAAIDGSSVVVESLVFHPLVADPRNITWTEPPFDDIKKTATGALYAKAGRGLASCSFSGDFGLAPQALGFVNGTGPVRQRRFENEVIALSSATTKEHVAEVIKNATIGFTGQFAVGGEPISGLTVGNVLKAKLATFNDDADFIALNVYDFYNERFYQVGGLSYSRTLSERGGGVVGVAPYQCKFTAVGPPLVSSSKTAWALSLLMNILPTWNAVNSFITSTSASNLLDNVAADLDLLLETPKETVQALRGNLEDMTSLMSGSLGRKSASLAGVLGTIAGIRRDFERIAEALTGTDTAFEPEVDTGAIEWSQDVNDDALDAYENAVTARNIAEELAFQSVAGKFYGMTRDDYQAFISAGGLDGGMPPSVRGSVKHVVQSTDTTHSIATLYGVAWDDIVRENRKTTEELLIHGQTITIPMVSSWGAIGLDGIPVFDRHVGTDILGKDMKLPLAAPSGELALVEGGACLAQGIRMISYAEVVKAMESGLDLGIDIVSAIIQRKIMLMYESDPRVVAVTAGKPQIDAVTATVNLEGIVIQAINGSVLESGS